KMFGVVAKGFIPDQDNDSLNINLRAAQGTSFNQMVDYAKKVAAVVIVNPNIEDFFLTTGGSFGTMNTARLSVVLTPRKTRRATAAEVAQQIRPQLLRFPGFRAFVTLPPALQIGGRVGNSSYGLTVQSANTEELYTWATRLEGAISELHEVQDVSSDMEMKSPRVDLILDRDKAAAIGLNAADVQNALYSGFGPKWSSTIYGARAQYRVL